MQSKRNSFIEASINTFSGFVISLLITYYILPYFGLYQNIQTSIIVVLIFTFTSLLRNYIIRRLFNKRIKYEKNTGS